ncbi:MAG: FliH/SctL family protein [Planctomycetota bacterium]
MSLIKADQLGVSPQSGIVLKLGDLRAEADALLNDTRARVASMIQQGQAQAREIMSDASERGYEQGHTEGREQGLAAGREEGRVEAIESYRAQLDALMIRWQQGIDQWEEARAAMLRDAEIDVLRLALTLAEKVIRRSITVDPSIIESQLHDALDAVASASQVDVSIHPDDRPLIEASLPALLPAMVDAQEVSLRDDDSIERGGCVVQSGRGVIDARIETQIHRLAEALLPDDHPDLTDEVTT